MQTRWLVALVAVMASTFVFINLNGALKLHIPTDEAAARISNLPPSPKIKLVSSPFPNVTIYEEKEQRRRVVLIHVGKTGGETVRHTLKITCRMRKNPVQQQLCWDSFANKTESELSRHTIGTMHCDLLLPKGSLERATTFLWTLRNPLDRVVSWFHYMNPANCRPLDDYHSTACNTNRSIASNAEKGSKWAGKFFGCFPTINHFADSLVADNSSTCSQIAWRTISGQASASSGHIYFNHQHYWIETLEKYPHKEVWVLRTESLWDDMVLLEKRLISTRNHQSTTPQESHQFSEKRNVTHGSEGHVQRDYLSVGGQERLCYALRDEIAIYASLLQKATNLETEAKDRSLEYVTKQCGEAVSSASCKGNRSITDRI